MENSQLNKLSMKIIYTFVLVVLLVFTACNTKEENKGASELSQTEITNQAFDFGVWITSQKGKTDDAYSEEFKKYKNGGIDEILINTGTDPKELERLVPIATKEGLKVIIKRILIGKNELREGLRISRLKIIHQCSQKYGQK